MGAAANLASPAVGAAVCLCLRHERLLVVHEDGDAFCVGGVHGGGTRFTFTFTSTFTFTFTVTPAMVHLRRRCCHG